MGWGSSVVHRRQAHADATARPLGVPPTGVKWLVGFALIFPPLVAVGLVGRALTATAQSPAPVAVLAGTEIFPKHALAAGSFSLRDQFGVQVSSPSLAEHVYAVTFMDSACKSQCTVEAAEIATAQRMLGGAHSPLTVIFVSVNPWHDTPASTEAFIRHYRVPGRCLWLMGTPAELLRVWTKYGILVQHSGSVVETHTSALYLVDRRGRVRVADAIPLLPRALAGSARFLFNQAPGKN